MSDSNVALLNAVLTVLTGYLGFHLTMHPAESFRAKSLYKTGFAILALGSCFLIKIQADRATAAQDRVLNAVKQVGERPLEATVKLPPISITMPPAPRPERVQQETARQSGNKSQETTRDILKKRALVLSAEILTFLSDRDAVGRPRVSLIPQKDESSTQYADRLGKESKAYLDFETDTVQRYDATFSGRAIALVTEMKNAGLDVQRVWYKPNSSETIQRFALGLVAVAQKDGSD